MVVCLVLGPKSGQPGLQEEVGAALLSPVVVPVSAAISQPILPVHLGPVSVRDYWVLHPDRQVRLKVALLVSPKAASYKDC